MECVNRETCAHDLVSYILAFSGVCPATMWTTAASAALLDAGGEAAITERQKKRIIFENIPNPMKIYTCVYFHVGLSRARENVINFLFGSFSLLVWNLWKTLKPWKAFLQPLQWVCVLTHTLIGDWRFNNARVPVARLTFHSRGKLSVCAYLFNYLWTCVNKILSIC